MPFFFAVEMKNLIIINKIKFSLKIIIAEAFSTALQRSTEPLSKKHPVLQKSSERALSLSTVISRLEDCVNPTPIKVYYLAPLLKKYTTLMSDVLGVNTGSAWSTPNVDADTIKRWKKDEKESLESRCARLEKLLAETRDALVSSVVGIDPENVLAPHNEDHLPHLVQSDDVRAFDERKDFGRLEDLIIAYHKACGETDNAHLAHTQVLRSSIVDRITRFFCDNKNDHKHMTQFADKYKNEHMNQGVVVATAKMYLFAHSPQHLRKPWAASMVQALPHLPPEIGVHVVLALRETALYLKDKTLAANLASVVASIPREEASFARHYVDILDAIGREMPAKKKGGKEEAHGHRHDEEEAGSEAEEHGGHGGHGSGRKGKKGGKKGSHHEEEEEDHHSGHGKKGGKGGKKGKKGHHDEEEEDHHNHYDEEEDDEGIIASITTSFGNMWSSIVGSGDEGSGSGGGNHYDEEGSGHSHKKSKKKGKKGGHHDDEEEEEHGGHGGKKKKGKKGGHHEEEEEEEHHGGHGKKKSSKKSADHSDHEPSRERGSKSRSRHY